MKKLNWVIVAAMALGLSGAASAADIENLSDQSCGDASGDWHFVNNQTGGAAPGTLQATWDSGDTCNVVAGAVNKNTQHFFCTASGALTSASTNLPGKLVLSDFTCGGKCEKNCEPPPK